nr:GAF domain-containing protein [Actinomycetota bacterium]
MVTTSAQAADQIDELLLLTRQHLDSDVALVAEIRDGRWIVRHVSARVDGWDVGVERAAEETYCQRLLSGQLPAVVPDTTRTLDGSDLAWLNSPVGSYLGVPLVLGGRDDAGTLCCFSAEPDLSLNGRDVAFLRLVARMVTDLFT